MKTTGQLLSKMFVNSMGLHFEPREHIRYYTCLKAPKSLPRLVCFIYGGLVAEKYKTNVFTHCITFDLQ